MVQIAIKITNTQSSVSIKKMLEEQDSDTIEELTLPASRTGHYGKIRKPQRKSTPREVEKATGKPLESHWKAIGKLKRTNLNSQKIDSSAHGKRITMKCEKDKKYQNREVYR